MALPQSTQLEIQELQRQGQAPSPLTQAVPALKAGLAVGEAVEERDLARQFGELLDAGLEGMIAMKDRLEKEGTIKPGEVMDPRLPVFQKDEKGQISWYKGLDQILRSKRFGKRVEAGIEEPVIPEAPVPEEPSVRAITEPETERRDLTFLEKIEAARDEGLISTEKALDFEAKIKAAKKDAKGLLGGLKITDIRGLKTDLDKIEAVEVSDALTTTLSQLRPVYEQAFDVIEKGESEEEIQRSLISIDQAIITLFNKVTDPRSVVRTSEYARTPEGAGFITSLIGRIERIVQGGAGLTNRDRTEIMVTAEAILAGVKGAAKEKVIDFTQTFTPFIGIDAISPIVGPRLKELEDITPIKVIPLPPTKFEKGAQSFINKISKKLLDKAKNKPKAEGKGESAAERRRRRGK